MTMMKPELLSPAGSVDSLKAAVNSGCDAVYLGGKKFGARAYAGNFDLKELEEVFDLEGLSKSPSFFDSVKMNWFNTEYIRKLTPEQFAEYATPWLAKVLDADKFDFARIASLLQARTEAFKQIPDEIIESARMDNAGEWKIMTRIMLPMCTPTMVTIAMFSFVSAMADSEISAKVTFASARFASAMPSAPLPQQRSRIFAFIFCPSRSWKNSRPSVRKRALPCS